MEYIFKPALIFTLILACMNACASYYGEFEIVAEVVSKDGPLYELAPIAERTMGGHDTESMEYSFYLFPKTLKKQIALPSNIRAGELVKLKKSIASNPGSNKSPAHYKEKYTFISIANKALKEERANVIANWQDGVEKEFYFKATKPFTKEVVSTPFISTGTIHGATGVLQFYIRLTEEFTGDYSEENIIKYFSDFHYNLFLTDAPIEIKRFFRMGESVTNSASKLNQNGSVFAIGETGDDQTVFEIEKIESNIVHGFINGKIDRSSLNNNAPKDYTGIPYKIRFEVPLH
jgi:hypothetical protein